MLFICFASFCCFISTDEIVIVRSKKIITVIDDAFCYINNFYVFSSFLRNESRTVFKLAPSVNYVSDPNLTFMALLEELFASRLVTLINPIRFYLILCDMEREAKQMALDDKRNMKINRGNKKINNNPGNCDHVSTLFIRIVADFCSMLQASTASTHVHDSYKHNATL